MTQSLDEMHAEYTAKGWPTIDYRRPDYCYQPCRTGLHVCGEHPDGMNALTIANFPTKDKATAEALFEVARLDCGEPDHVDGDFVVDLMINHDCDRDFTMNRQMLERLTHLAEGFSP